MKKSLLDAAGIISSRKENTEKCHTTCHVNVREEEKEGEKYKILPPPPFLPYAVSAVR